MIFVFALFTTLICGIVFFLCHRNCEKKIEFWREFYSIENDNLTRFYENYIQDRERFHHEQQMITIHCWHESIESTKKLLKVIDDPHKLEDHLNDIIVNHINHRQ